MHRPLAFRLATILLLAAYGGVGVLGYGLHSLLGIHHHGVSRSAESAHMCTCMNCPFHGARHDGEPAESGHGDLRSASHEADGGCPLCSLLGQLLTVPDAGAAELAIWAVPHEPPVSDRAQPNRLAAEHPARGPPLRA